jgi:hypothetical protein
MRISTELSLAVLLSTVALTSAAHHSMPALFDTGSTVTVSGEVTEFQFISPHAYILMDIVDGAGERVHWQIETYPPGMLIRKGLTPATVQPGQTISAAGHPARDGRPLMRLLTVTMPNGDEKQIQ